MQPRRILMALPLLLLAGCAKDSGLLDPSALYPDQITHCADAPKVPARPVPGSPRTDEQKTLYTLGVHTAYVDCKSVVAATAERKKLYSVQYEKEHYGYFERLWRSATGEGA